jgi:hypothetical protein
MGLFDSPAGYRTNPISAAANVTYYKNHTAKTQLDSGPETEILPDSFVPLVNFIVGS